MIIAKAPMRLSFVGGGSDLPSFLEKSETGRVVTTTLNKFVYVIVKKRVLENHRIVYSDIEVVENFDQIRHEIIRNSLKYLDIKPRLEIYSIADLPAKGTGLGASSAFTLALTAALKRFKGESSSNLESAEGASFIEMKLCMKSSGFQDQYASALGGLSVIDFDQQGYLKHSRVDELLNEDWTSDLNEHVALIPISGSRNSDEILRNITFLNGGNVTVQEKIRDLVDPFVSALMKQDYVGMGLVLHENWNLKKALNEYTTNTRIDGLYEMGLRCGAHGGKLLGAGQSGYIAFVVDDSKKFYSSMGLGDSGLRITGEKMEIIEL